MVAVLRESEGVDFLKVAALRVLGWFRGFEHPIGQS